MVDTHLPRETAGPCQSVEAPVVTHRRAGT